MPNIVKWKNMLSTTEPFNNIGLVKVRQDNTSETWEIRITENGRPYDFSKREIKEVYFNTKFSKDRVVEQRGEIIDAKKGIIQYTMNNYDMQQAKPFQAAYFEFRSVDGSYVDSTQTFFYHIIPSKYQACTEGSTYIIRLEELFKLYQDYMSKGIGDWEKFVESNREILESIDPGGKILTELIDGRYSKMLDKHFPSLQARGDFWDEYAYGLGVSPKWFGAKGDGVTDDTEAIQNWIDFLSENKVSGRLGQGTYMIKGHVDNPKKTTQYLHAEGGIQLKDNVTIYCEPKSVLKVIPNDKTAYNVLWSFNAKNIKITGHLELEGDLRTHEGVLKEYGHGLVVFGGENIYIEGLKAYAFMGDGVCTDVNDYNELKPVKNMKMINCELFGNGRNNLSLQGNNGFYAKNCKFKNANTFLPKAGVDCEPWNEDLEQSKDVMKNIVFDQCEFSGNSGSGFLSDGANNEIKLVDCNFNENSKFDIETYETKKIELVNMTLDTREIVVVNTDEFIIRDSYLSNTTILNEDINNYRKGIVQLINLTIRNSDNINVFKNINGKKTNVYVDNVDMVGPSRLLATVSSNVIVQNVNFRDESLIGIVYSDSLIVDSANLLNVGSNNSLIQFSGKTIKLINFSNVGIASDYIIYIAEDSNPTLVEFKNCDIESKKIFNKTLTTSTSVTMRNCSGTVFKYDNLAGINTYSAIENPIRGLKRFNSVQHYKNNASELSEGQLFYILFEGENPAFKLYIYFGNNNVFELNATKFTG